MFYAGIDDEFSTMALAIAGPRQGRDVAAICSRTAFLAVHLEGGSL
jgi:hypothetical protein